MSSPSRPFILILPSLRHVVKGRRRDLISSYLLPYHSSSSSLSSSLHPHPLHSLNTRSITMATQCTFHPSSSFDDDHSLQVSASIVLSPRSGQSSPSNLLSRPTSDAFCEYIHPRSVEGPIRLSLFHMISRWLEITRDHAELRDGLFVLTTLLFIPSLFVDSDGRTKGWRWKGEGIGGGGGGVDHIHSLMESIPHVLSALDILLQDFLRMGKIIFNFFFNSSFLSMSPFFFKFISIYLSFYISKTFSWHITFVHLSFFYHLEFPFNQYASIHRLLVTFPHFLCHKK